MGKPNFKKKGNNSKFKDPKTDATDYNEKNPVFCFKYVDTTHGFNLCDNELKAKLVDSILAYSQRSWKEMFGAPKHGNGTGFGTIDKTALSKTAYPSIISEDTKKLEVLRFANNAPIVGKRDKQVFHVVYLDPNFDLYDHGTK